MAERFRRYRPDKIGHTGRMTDRQSDSIYHPPPYGGIKSVREDEGKGGGRRGREGRTGCRCMDHRSWILTGLTPSTKLRYERKGHDLHSLFQMGGSYSLLLPWAKILNSILTSVSVACSVSYHCVRPHLPNVLRLTVPFLSV